MDGKWRKQSRLKSICHLCGTYHTPPRQTRPRLSLRSPSLHWAHTCSTQRRPGPHIPEYPADVELSASKGHSSPKKGLSLTSTHTASSEQYSVIAQALRGSETPADPGIQDPHRVSPNPAIFEGPPSTLYATRPNPHSEEIAAALRCTVLCDGPKHIPKAGSACPGTNVHSWAQDGDVIAKKRQSTWRVRIMMLSVLVCM